ncbi:hypothetical protein VARIO8X_120050 [Burkholderiales bacterium 8X]|nr:hypothetical protein VARIO8X_120050 [Burkholderiales bacterium 8X]
MDRDGRAGRGQRHGLGGRHGKSRGVRQEREVGQGGVHTDRDGAIARWRDAPRQDLERQL